MTISSLNPDLILAYPLIISERYFLNWVKPLKKEKMYSCCFMVHTFYLMLSSSIVFLNTVKESDKYLFT